MGRENRLKLAEKGGGSAKWRLQTFFGKMAAHGFEPWAMEWSTELPGFGRNRAKNKGKSPQTGRNRWKIINDYYRKRSHAIFRVMTSSVGILRSRTAKISRENFKILEYQIENGSNRPKLVRIGILAYIWMR